MISLVHLHISIAPNMAAQAGIDSPFWSKRDEASGADVKKQHKGTTQKENKRANAKDNEEHGESESQDAGEASDQTADAGWGDLDLEGGTTEEKTPPVQRMPKVPKAPENVVHPPSEQRSSLRVPFGSTYIGIHSEHAVSAAPHQSYLDYKASYARDKEKPGAEAEEVAVLVDKLLYDTSAEDDEVIAGNEHLKPSYLTLKEQLKVDLNHPYNNFTMLVHGDGGGGEMAGVIAAMHPEAMVLAMCGASIECAQNATRGSNVLVGGLHGALPEMLEEIDGGPGRLGVSFATYQYFTSLVDICTGLLPYECETAVGNALLFSRVSFFPNELPHTKYFEYWGEDSLKLLHPALEYARRKFGVDVSKPHKVKGRLTSKGLLRVEVGADEGIEPIRKPPKGMEKGERQRFAKNEPYIVSQSGYYKLISSYLWLRSSCSLLRSPQDLASS